MSVDDLYIQTNVSVGTTAVELKVGASRNPDGTVVRIYNKGDETVFIGPSSSVNATPGDANQGEPLYKDQWVQYHLFFQVPIYGITASGTSTVLVAELGNADG